MPRSAASTLFVAAIANIALIAVGRSQTASTSSAETAPLFKKADDSTGESNGTVVGRRPRVISADVAAQLSASVPKYTPPPPKPPPVPEDQLPDLREIDKPKNGIVRLPKYVVHEKPPPVLSERVVSTSQGLADIAMKRYLTEMDRALNSFTLPLFGTSPEDRALAMYAEDERLKNMAELKDDAGLVSASDKAAGVYVKRQVEQTFIRPGNFDWKPIGR